MRALSMIILAFLVVIVMGQQECEGQDSDGDGWTVPDGDCDDQDESTHPGADEICDGIDQDCDEEVDEGLAGTDSSCPALSCLDVLDSGNSLGDGEYWIEPTGDSTVEATLVLCDMTTDGGGWTLVSSNYSGDSTFPVGTERTGFFLDIEGYSENPSIYADYLIGPAIDSMVFSEGRIFSDMSDDGSVVSDISWSQSCINCYLENNFDEVTYLEDHNLSTLGCGSAHYCNLDGQYVDTYDGSYNSNSNQRTIGGICTQSTPDPSSGTYVGHGKNEASISGEGNYFSGSSGCTYYDFEVYSTWVR